MTPEQVAEHAFALLTPDGADSNQYHARLVTLAAAIQHYGDERAQAERDRIMTEIERYFAAARASDETPLPPARPDQHDNHEQQHADGQER